MPYASNADIPASVRRALPEAARTIWRKAFNSALVTYKGNEQKAAAVAWSAVGRQYEKRDGQWVKKESARMKTDAKHYQEAISLDGATVDRAARRVFGLSLLGPVSRNGYRFRERAMQQAAALAEGAKVFVDHQTDRKAGPSVRDLAGSLTNVRFEGGDTPRVRGDILARVGANGDMLLDDAEHNPRLAGFSFHHTSREQRVGKEREITEMEAVHSVDYVAVPATVGGMFETDQNTSGDDEMKPEDVTLEWLRENAPTVYAEAVEAGKADADTQAQLTTAKAENAELRTKLAAHEQAEAERAKRETVDAVLAESDLTDEAKKAIRPVLESAKDAEAMKAICETIKSAAATKATKAQERAGAGETATVESLKKAVGI